MLIGIATLKTEPWELEDNFQRMEGYVREAARRRARVVVAPESVLDGYVFNEDPESTREGMREIAQTVPNGPYIARARELDKDLETALVSNQAEQAEAENSAPSGPSLATGSFVPGGSLTSGARDPKD